VSGGNLQERLDELQADRVMWGLSFEEREELENAMVRADLDPQVGRSLQLGWERAASTATLSMLDRVERMPEALRQRVVAACPLTPAKGQASPRTPARGFGPLLLAAGLLIGFGMGIAIDLLRTDGPQIEAQSTADLLRDVQAASDSIAYPFNPGGTELVKVSDTSGAEVVWSDALQKGVMRIRGLPQNDPQDFVYQLWIFDGGRIPEGKDLLAQNPVDGGVFDVDSNGEVLVPIRAKLDVRKGTAFAVTVEEPGGVVVSKRDGLIALLATPPGK